MINRAFDWVACQMGKPIVILSLVSLIILGFLMKVGIDPLNITISIASFAVSLMIVGKQDKAECKARVRDEAMHAKLDELIAVSSKARNELIGSEEKSEEEILDLKRSGG